MKAAKPKGISRFFVGREALNKDRIRIDKNFNKNGVFVLALILCLCAGCGSSDSTKADKTEQDEADTFMENVSENQGVITRIQDELQWGENFSWSYCPEEYEENEDGEKAIGHFIQNADPKNASMCSEQDDVRVLVFRQEFEEVSLYEQIKEKEDQYEGCLIDIIGGTELTLAARVEAGTTCHELHLAQGEVGYTFRAMNLSKQEWYDFLEELLLAADLHWGEQDAYIDTVFPALTFPSDYSGKDCWWLQFDGVLLPMEWEQLISCSLYEDGLRICYIQYDRQEEESVAGECLLRHGEAFPAYETESELFDWFREKIPAIQSYAAYLTEEVFENADFDDENTAVWESDKTPYREIMTEDGQGLLYLTYEDKYYEFLFGRAWGDIWRCPFKQYAMRGILGIDSWDAGFVVTVSENGLVNRCDKLRQKYYLQQEIGENIFSFNVERVYLPGDAEREPEDIGRQWKISVYRNGESEPFQEIEVESSAYDKCPVSFYDFNADGYEDLIVYYYYGANGGSESRYLWSPSRESFVYFPDLEYFGSYYVDPGTRRLYIHYHGSAISGSNEVYQWKNEMDCELLKDISYYPASYESGEGMEIKVSRYDGDREEILSNYIYSDEEYDARSSDIWGTYNEDFIWEQEVTVDGENYILRYAENRTEDVAIDKAGSGGYLGRLYVYREDTYLVRVLESDIVLPWSRMEWTKKEDGKYLIIHYTDPLTGEESGSRGIPVSAFKVADWELVSP